MAEEVKDQITTPASTLAFYEEIFKHRYAEKDAEYIKTLNSSTDPPPCVENWYSRPKRAFDWGNRNTDYQGRQGSDSYSNNRGGSYRGYNNYGDRRGNNREQYSRRDYTQGDNRDYRDQFGEQRNKYFRGNQARGYHR